MSFLDGLRVLDLSRYLPGPYATHVLCEMGAEVIHVEEPGAGDPMRSLPPLVDGVGHAFAALHAGKKSVVLDLKAPGARATLLRLAAGCRVFVESFRPGVAARLGLGYEDVRAARPDVVYCSLSGFGQTGPFREAPGHDINFVGLAGLLDVGPLPGVTVGDLCGGLMGAAAILGAAWSARSAHIDLSCTDAMLSWMHLHAAHSLAPSPESEHARRFLRSAFACYRIYETADGGQIAIGALEPKFWQALCAALGRAELAPLQFDVDQQPRVIAELARILRGRTREEWTAQLAALPVTPVLSLDEAVDHPLFTGRGMIEEVTSSAGTLLRRLAFPARAAGDRPPEARRVPALGEHTDEILGGLRGGS